MHATPPTHWPDLKALAQADPPPPWLAGFELQRWTRGALVAVPGDRCNRTLLVRSGRLRVYLAGASRDLSLAFLEPGELYTTHTPTYIEAADDSSAWAIDTQRFAQRLISDPSATPVMMRVLGRLLRNAVTLIEDLAFREVPARLARYLVEQAMQRGLPDGDQAVRVPLAGRMEDLASLLGTTRQTVSALVNQWERDGLLQRLGRQELRLCDLSALKALADP